MKDYKKEFGFTIVELMIVIVVIAILAAISIVAYTGVQNRAHDAAIQNDLRQMGTLYEQWIAFNGWPADLAAATAMSDATAEEFRPSVGSYDTNRQTTTDPRGHVNNLYFCIGRPPSTEWGLMARSHAGTIFEYKNGGVRQHEDQILALHSDFVCPALGIDDSRWYRAFHHNSNGWHDSLGI